MSEEMMGLICVTVLAILLVCILVVTARIVIVYMKNSKKKSVPRLRHEPSKSSQLSNPKNPDTVGETTNNERYSRFIPALMNNHEEQKHIYDVIDANDKVSPPNKQTYENLKPKNSALTYQNFPLDTQNGMIVSPTSKHIASYLEPNDIHSMNLVQPKTKSATTRKTASYVEPQEISALSMALFKAELAEEEKQKKKEKERQEEAMKRMQ